MKKLNILLVIILFPLIGLAQSATTEALQKQYNDAFSLYFYKNTLRMLNQMDSPEFDELIKDIEKMKFLMIDKSKMKFATADYKKLLKQYSAESYEEIMTTRYQGRNFDIYLKDIKGSTLGTVMLVNDSTSFYVLDILGTIDVSKATQLFSALDDSSDIGQKIKSFLHTGESPKNLRGFKNNN